MSSGRRYIRYMEGVRLVLSPLDDLLIYKGRDGSRLYMHRTKRGGRVFYVLGERYLELLDEEQARLYVERLFSGPEEYPREDEVELISRLWPDIFEET